MRQSASKRETGLKKKKGPWKQSFPSYNILRNETWEKKLKIVVPSVFEQSTGNTKKEVGSKTFWVPLDGWFGEGDLQVVVITHVVIVKVDQALNSFFHGCHLN